MHDRRGGVTRNLGNSDHALAALAFALPPKDDTSPAEMQGIWPGSGRNYPFLWIESDIMGSNSQRIVSMDQFRGYTVAGMVLVNFLGDFGVIHPVFKHHNTYLSYADTIMPSFHFAVGFALRLTLLKRLESLGPAAAYARMVRRNLGLILLSMVLTMGDQRFPTWSALCQKGFWGALAGPLKCDFWGTLAIIGVTSLAVLPVMAARARTRIACVIGCLGLHAWLSHAFYFDFMYGRPGNWLGQFWGADETRGLDGGPLGFLAWAVPQLVGSLAYDAVAGGSPGRAFPKLFFGGLLLLGLGYGLSGFSLLYPVTEPATTEEGTALVARSPVVPPLGELSAKSPRELLAPPPFVQPTAQEQRELSYWLMGKRVVTLPFNLASTGFALALYALFVLLCDIGSLQMGLFRTFGQNPLATYLIHEMINHAVTGYVPGDSPLYWVTIGFVIYASLTYAFVHYLEKNGIFLRM